MANAATAKRGTGLKCSSDEANTKHSASASGSTSSNGSTAAGETKTKRPHKSATIELAPSNASLSEKRRIAALISWQKRRKSSASKHSSPKSMQVSKRKSSEMTAPVTVPKAKARRTMQQAMATPSRDAQDQPPAKRQKSVSGTSKGKVLQLTEAEKFSAIRREAAKLGWERRRIQLAAAVAAAAASNSKKKHTASSEKRSVTEIRREAAKLGWEKRRKHLAESMSGSSTFDDSSSVDERSTSLGHDSLSSVNIKSSSTASRRKSYSASSRRRAAILGWEKRRSEKAERRSAPSPPPLSLDSSVFASMLSKPQSIKEVDNTRYGTKRSRRLADDASKSYEDEVKRIAQIVSYLRVSRGWMEFQPSSRLGSGTAIYGYIPSSIASFIRSGTITQRTVLDHGTLGVHYALDWDGYGGLKDMLATFGEDYAPYPTEEMLELSRVTEWELGEDLPWKEWMDVEEEKLIVRSKEKEESLAIATSRVDDMNEIMYVATILANLDRTAVDDDGDDDDDDDDDCESRSAVEEEDPSIARSACGSDLYNYSENESHSKKVAAVNNSKANDAVLASEPRYDFKHWNFGL